MSLVKGLLVAGVVGLGVAGYAARDYFPKDHYLVAAFVAPTGAGLAVKPDDDGEDEVFSSKAACEVEAKKWEKKLAQVPFPVEQTCVTEDELAKLKKKFQS